LFPGEILLRVAAGRRKLAELMKRFRLVGKVSGKRIEWTRGGNFVFRTGETG
jgi:hypothetical protein